MQISFFTRLCPMISAVYQLIFFDLAYPLYTSGGCQLPIYNLFTPAIAPRFPPAPWQK